MACFEIKNLNFSYPGAPGGASEGGREHSGTPGYFDTPKALQDIDLTVDQIDIRPRFHFLFRLFRTI